MLLALSLAAAQDDALSRAHAAQRAGDVAGEAAACAEVPDTAYCAERLRWIDARRDADGGLGTITALEAVRRDLATAAAERRAAVEALVARPGVNEVVAAELTCWLARDALSRGDAAGAKALLLPLPPGRERDVLLGEARARLGEPAEGDAPDRIRWERFQARLRAVSTAVLAVWGVAAVGLAVRGVGAGVRPWGLVPLGLGGLACAAVAAWADEDGGRAALGLVPAQAAVFLLAAYAQPALAAHPRARTAFGVGTAASMGAAGVLTLHALGLRW